MINVSVDDLRNILGENIAPHVGYMAKSNRCITRRNTLFEKIRRHNPNRPLIATDDRRADGSAPEHGERPDTCLTLAVEEATGGLGISRAFGYETVVRGEIPCVRSGGRILVANVGLERMLDG